MRLSLVMNWMVFKVFIEGFFDVEWEVEKSACWLVYWAFFKNMTYGDANLACVAYRGLVFTDKERVCEKGMADSNADDGNILTSVEVRRCNLNLFFKFFNIVNERRIIRMLLLLFFIN
jgi:hypothetical protein